MGLDYDALSLTEIIQIQTHLSEVLRRRFQKKLALVFTDVVGSTQYFARFGDEAGRGLQQRHFDLLQQTLPSVDGRVVDTAGDGAFAVFPSVEAATNALIELQKLNATQNTTFPSEHQLSVRCGIHWGNVLTDGVAVTGDSVNFCSRIASTAQGGEIRLSREAFLELGKEFRLRCKALPALELKGVPAPVSLILLEWRDRNAFPTQVRIEETGETIPLPGHDVITFGRLREHEGLPANDIVLTLGEQRLTDQISRWHFELHRQPDGFLLRSVTNQPTQVGAETLRKGGESRVRPGSAVRLSGVVTLTFLGDAPAGQSARGITETIVGDDLLRFIRPAGGTGTGNPPGSTGSGAGG
jgi:class 3 adenylate cyclase